MNRRNVIAVISIVLLAGCQMLTASSDPPLSDSADDGIITGPMAHPTDPPDGTGEHLMGNLDNFVKGD